MTRPRTSTRTAPLPQVTCTPTGPVPWRTAFVTSSLVSRRTTSKRVVRQVAQPLGDQRASLGDRPGVCLQHPVRPLSLHAPPPWIVHQPLTHGVVVLRPGNGNPLDVRRPGHAPLFTWAVHTHVVPTDPFRQPAHDRFTAAPGRCRLRSRARWSTSSPRPSRPARTHGRWTAAPSSSPTQEFADAAEAVAGELNASGIGRGDRVGVRIKSGTTDLYVAIVGVLMSGAAYVPVDADDPDDRARLVFGEAEVAAVVGNDLAIALRRPASRRPHRRADPTPDDDAWVIFTSGSTGTPKGVAVSHRSAAAFVDAESRMFLQDRPDRHRRPGDGGALGRVRRVLRGDVAGLGPRRAAWSRRPGRWSAAASTSARGWWPTTSPSSPRCRRWSRCGRPSRWPPYAC